MSLKPSSRKSWQNQSWNIYQRILKSSIKTSWNSDQTSLEITTQESPKFVKEICKSWLNQSWNFLWRIINLSLEEFLKSWSNRHWKLKFLSRKPWQNKNLREFEKKIVKFWPKVSYLWSFSYVIKTKQVSKFPPNNFWNSRLGNLQILVK